MQKLRCFTVSSIYSMTLVGLATGRSHRMSNIHSVSSVDHKFGSRHNRNSKILCGDSVGSSCKIQLDAT